MLIKGLNTNCPSLLNTTIQSRPFRSSLSVPSDSTVHIQDSQPPQTLPSILVSVAWFNKQATCCSTVKFSRGRRARMSRSFSPITTFSYDLQCAVLAWPSFSSSLQQTWHLDIDTQKTPHIFRVYANINMANSWWIQHFDLRHFSKALQFLKV